MKRMMTILAASAALLFAACGPADDGDDSGGNGGTNNSDVKQAQHPNVDCEEIDNASLCTISGEITEDLTLDKQDGVIWRISGPVFVGNDTDETVLEIKAGVTVFADAASTDTTFLAIRRNSKIQAMGTKDAPVVFTPSTPEGERERGLWGGLIINGKAPLNTGQEAEGEGNTGKYGGSDPRDNSGTLKYLRVEFAGDLITSKNELNGIAFQGVGSETTIDYVQVHMNSDDGVEFFGGTARAKHLVLTRIGDDSLDWTDGWQGKVQYAVIHQADDGSDRGIEADNNGNDNEATPRSNPTLSNLTLVGGDKGSHGILLREGTGANIYNAVVTGFAEACIDLDHEATFKNGWNASDSTYNGELMIANSIVHDCNSNFSVDEDGMKQMPFTTKEWFHNWDSNQTANPKLEGVSDDTPTYSPASGSPAASGSMQPMGDDFFEEAGHIGAVPTDSDWTQGWTTHAPN